MPTLEELEGQVWDEPEFGSYLVRTCHQLRRKPVEEFSTEDLRIMIGQKIGLPFLIPLAFEALETDPLAEGDYYPGDLLAAVMNAEAFCAGSSELVSRICAVAATARGRLQSSWSDSELLDEIETFISKYAT